MKKEFPIPEVEVIKFEVGDIITASGGGDVEGEGEGGSGVGGGDKYETPLG